MELFLDCLPCLLKQVLEASRMVKADEELQTEIMTDAVSILSKHKEYRCAPKLAEALHGTVKKRTGVEDPYGEIKSRDILSALSLEPLIQDYFSEGRDRLLQALKISATGNVMDAALYSNLNLASCLKAELEIPFAVCDRDKLEKKLETAKMILILGDNAGEVVFDKILVAQFAKDYEVLFAVREGAIINDATADDARRAGMDRFAKIISTGCKSPGAVPEDFSPEFKEIFDVADIVISKGQGNYEALSDSNRDIYFLLKAKCPKIAKALGVQVGEYVFKYIK